MFKFSDESHKLKNQVLMLSGVCLFIAISGALPGKIAIIGLDLSANKNVSGWFLFAITLYFLVKFIILSGFEMFGEQLPKLIQRITRHTAGDTVGLTEQEIYEQDAWASQDLQDGDIGTRSGELNDINRKRKEVEIRYKASFRKIYSGWVYFSDFVFPFGFSVVSVYALYTFQITNVAFRIL